MTAFHSYDQFAERLGETFTLRLSEEHRFELTLTSASRLSDHSYDYPGREADRLPFSLLFLGPRDPILPQRIYAFENDTMGRFEMFIVPVGRDQSGVQYEAIFT